MQPGNLILIFILALSASWAAYREKLTVTAALAGFIIALILFLAFSWMGPACMAAFFLMGTIATSWKRKWKEEKGLVQERESRNVGQVLANSGVPVLLALLSLLLPEKTNMFLLMMAGAFSSAAADTVSSELGMVYGKNPFHIISLRKDIKGKDGVVSWEGFNFGILASLILAFIFYLLHPAFHDAVAIVIAGTMGNLADSILGASLERKGRMGNDAVNFCNTLLAALVMLIL
jgi:uncharacterized protein (TIGR00297 family)